MLPTWAIQIIFAISLIGGAYWYYTSTQAKIAQLQKNNVALELQAEVNAKTIEGLKSAAIFREKAYQTLNSELAGSETRRIELIKIFQEHDLKKLSIAKPGLIENIINEGTNSTLTELESITSN